MVVVVYETEYMCVYRHFIRVHLHHLIQQEIEFILIWLTQIQQKKKRFYSNETNLFSIDSILVKLKIVEREKKETNRQVFFFWNQKNECADRETNGLFELNNVYWTKNIGRIQRVLCFRFYWKCNRCGWKTCAKIIH